MVPASGNESRTLVKLKLSVFGLVYYPGDSVNHKTSLYTMTPHIPKNSPNSHVRLMSRAPQPIMPPARVYILKISFITSERIAYHCEEDCFGKLPPSLSTLSHIKLVISLVNIKISSLQTSSYRVAKPPILLCTDNDGAFACKCILVGSFFFFIYQQPGLGQ